MKYISFERHLPKEDLPWLGKTCKKCGYGIYCSIYNSSYCYICGHSPHRRAPTKIEANKYQPLPPISTVKPRSRKPKHAVDPLTGRKPRRQISYEEMVELRRRKRAGDSVGDLMRDYNVGEGVIYRAMHRTSYRGRPL